MLAIRTRGAPAATGEGAHVHHARRTTSALELPRTAEPDAYVLLVSAKQGRRAARSAAAVTSR